MCEYDPRCSKQDDPFALMLWNGDSLKRATWLVRCPPKRHPLAALFDLPTRGTVLVAPAYEMYRKSYYLDPARPDDLEHMHAGAIDLAEYESDESERGRCPCGTWHYWPQRITSRPFGTKNGQPYTLAEYVYTADDPRNPRRHADVAESGAERQERLD